MRGHGHGKAACPGVSGNTHGLPGGFHTTLFPTLCVDASFEGVETVWKDRPCIAGLCREEAFLAVVSGSPFGFLYIHTEAERFSLFRTEVPRKIVNLGFSEVP